MFDEEWGDWEEDNEDPTVPEENLYVAYHIRGKEGATVETVRGFITAMDEAQAGLRLGRALNIPQNEVLIVLYNKAPTDHITEARRRGGIGSGYALYEAMQANKEWVQKIDDQDVIDECNQHGWQIVGPWRWLTDFKILVQVQETNVHKWVLIEDGDEVASFTDAEMLMMKELCEEAEL